MEPWILLSTRKSWRRMSSHQFVLWSSSTFLHHETPMANEVASKKPGLKSDSDALVWPWTQTSWSKTLQCGWINNSVKEEWDKIHVKDSLPVMINDWLQLLCTEWHNQLCSLNHSYVNLWDFAQAHPSNYWNTPAYLAPTTMSHSQPLKWPFWCPFVYAETHTVLTADILDL